jgi:hypothetical protein
VQDSVIHNVYNFQNLPIHKLFNIHTITMIYPEKLLISNVKKEIESQQG